MRFPKKLDLEFTQSKLSAVMPDWFYKTVSQPLLFKLPAKTSRDLAVGFMARLGNLPFGLGGRFIDLLGHMQPHHQLAREIFGIRFPGPTGLGPVMDPCGQGLNAWSRFGFGFLDLGPVLIGANTSTAAPLRRVEESESVWAAKPGQSVNCQELADNIRKRTSRTVPIIVRVLLNGSLSPSAAALLVAEQFQALAGAVDLFAIDGRLVTNWNSGHWEDFWKRLRNVPDAGSRKQLCVVNAGMENNELLKVFEAADQHVCGWIVDGSTPEEGGWTSGRESIKAVLECIRALRTLGASGGIIASGGVHQPADARDMLNAGASLVEIDTGMIFSGPGLCKRINEALLPEMRKKPGLADPDRPVRWGSASWFWTALLGLAMLIGGLMAFGIASTRVILPYDEAFCGWNVLQMRAYNPNLPRFLVHDRVTLAGTMTSIGLLYLALSLNGVRRGEHWARVAILTSAGTGFFSFFLFLGFGYFDPFHGFVTAILFQLFAMGVHASEEAEPGPRISDWTATTAWHRSLWGQMLLVIHSGGLLIAGIVIAGIGIGSVLVHEDLEYLGTTTRNIQIANAKLLPLVAHDRATLGGMLVASGLLYLLSALWGIRKGSSWLWHALLWSGVIAYGSAIGVHFIVGYVDLKHMIPAFTGLLLLLSALALLRGWMCPGKESSHNSR